MIYKVICDFFDSCHNHILVFHYREEEDEEKLDFRLTTIDVTSHTDAEDVGPDVIVNLTFDDYGKLIGKYILNLYDVTYSLTSHDIYIFTWRDVPWRYQWTTMIDLTSHTDAEDVGPDVIVNLTFDDYGKLIGRSKYIFVPSYLRGMKCYSIFNSII